MPPVLEDCISLCVFVPVEVLVDILGKNIW